MQNRISLKKRTLQYLCETDVRALSSGPVTPRENPQNDGWDLPTRKLWVLSTQQAKMA
jgi:hypothetical protein